MKMRTMAKIILLLGLAVTFFLSTNSAHALLTLRLSDGTTTFDVSDGDVVGSEVDASSTSGVITYSGLFGNFNLNVTTGVQSGTNTLPVLAFNTFEVSNPSGGTLTVSLSNTNFEPTSSPTGFTMHGSGTAIVGSGTVSFYSYIDNTNTLFGEGSPLGSLGPYTSASFSGDNNGSISSLATPYALTAKAIINLNGNTMMQTTSNIAIVPEPISSILFILGGATFGLRHCLKSRKRQ